MQRHHEKYKMSVQTVQTVAPSTLQHDYIYILHEFPLKKYVQFTLPSHSWHILTMFRQHPNTRDRAAVFLPSKIQPLGWPSSHTLDHLRSLTWSAVFFLRGIPYFLNMHISYIIYSHPGGDEPASGVLGRSSPWLVVQWLNNPWLFSFSSPSRIGYVVGPLPSMGPLFLA